MTDVYANMGVDVSEADRGVAKIAQRIKQTWPNQKIRESRSGNPMPNRGDVLMEIGYFANVVDLGGGLGLASTIDGVGSKTIIADLMRKWDTIGIDCVAMNVNDLICIGAKPLSMVDYIGVEVAEADILDQIAIGLTDGAKAAGISITGGEISQLPDSISGFDLVGTAFGLVPVNHIIIGQDVIPGDVIIGIESNGIHSNGLTMARRVLIESAYLDYHEGREDLRGRSIGEELLRPTFIYVKEVRDLIAQFHTKALINITGDGLLNLNRIKADVGFVIDAMPPRMPIFDLIQKQGNLDDATMFQTFNMGVGYCVIIPADQAQGVITTLAQHGRTAWVIGSVIPDQDKTIYLAKQKIIGRGKRFAQEP